MTSAWSPKRLPESLLHYMRTRGKDRILFASDYPVLSMERCLGEAERPRPAGRGARRVALRQRRRVLLRGPPSDPLAGPTESATVRRRKASLPGRSPDVDARGHDGRQADRRRQPLLRAARRLHPAPRQEVPRPRRPAGAGRQAGQAADGRARSTGSSRTRRSTRSSCRAASTRCSGARSPRASTPRSLMQVEPLRARVPRPRPARRGDGRAGPRRRAAVPHARLRRRGGAARRHPRHDGHRRRLQPLAGGRLGLRPPSTASSPCRCCRWPTRTPPSPRSTRCSSAGRASCTSAPPRCPAPTAPAGRSATSCTTRCGPGWPRRRSRWPSTSATAATTGSSAAAWGGERHASGSATATCSAGCSSSDRAIHDTDRLAARPRRVQAPPHAAGRQHRERVGLAARCWPSGCASRPTRRRGRSPRTRSTPCAATSGSRRTSRRTSARWPS